MSSHVHHEEGHTSYAREPEKHMGSYTDHKAAGWDVEEVSSGDMQHLPAAHLGIPHHQ